jgi:hypothetical protein
MTTAILLGISLLLAPDLLDEAARGAFVGPVRYRHEYRDDADFRADLDDSDHRDLLKVGFGLDMQLLEGVRARAQARVTRTWGRDVEPDVRVDLYGQDHLDLYEGFADLTLPGSPLSVKVGRQVFSYGEERLIGPLEWVQNARSFDAVRARVALEKGFVDGWYGRLVQFEGPDDRNANRPIDTTDFFGLYGSIQATPEVLLEPYTLTKYDDNHPVRGERGELAHHSLVVAPGLRAVVELPLGFAITEDALVQVGERGPDELFAWGAATRLQWKAPEGIRPLQNIELEYVYGSGDNNPTDGKAGTLDNFFPTNHKFYGELDLASWQNIHDLELTVRLALAKVALRDPPPAAEAGAPKPPKPPIWERAAAQAPPATLPIGLEVGGHCFWLASEKDAWYSASRGVIRRDPTGSAGRYLGEELDVILRAGPLALGYAHFFPGSYVEETTPGRTSGADLVYLEAAVTF